MRRWIIPLRTVSGDEMHLVVTVACGGAAILSSIGTLAIAVPPEGVERIRRVLTEARAVALQERGTW